MGIKKKQRLGIAAFICFKGYKGAVIFYDNSNDSGLFTKL